MNKPWQISKQHPLVKLSSIFLAVALVAPILLGGCYSGWNRPKQNGDKDRSSDDTSSDQVPFGFLLLEVIRPSLTPGRNLCGNGDSPTLVAFRQHEWAEREAALEKALTPLAAHFEKKEIEIDGSDCRSMRSVETRAGEISPRGSRLIPKDSDPLGRKLIHLKVVFWAGAAPSLSWNDLPNTFQFPWADWAHLGWNSIVGLEEYQQFVMADQSGGFFSNWHDSVPWTNRIDGTAIQNITPTDQATADRQVTIATDTAALVQWLRTVAAPPEAPDGKPTGPEHGRPLPGPRSGGNDKPKLNPNGHDFLQLNPETSPGSTP